MYTELKHIARHLLSWLLFFLVLTIFFFSFGIKEVFFLGQTFLAPFPTVAHSFTATLFAYMKNALLPAGVELIVTSPLTAFIAQIKIALFLGFLTSFPALMYTIISYLSPALFYREKRAALRALLPSSILFVAGVLFAFIIIIPPTFNALYQYATSLVNKQVLLED